MCRKVLAEAQNSFYSPFTKRGSTNRLFIDMWLFKRKRMHTEQSKKHLPCPHCRSLNTGMIFDGDSLQADYVKVWRGKRYFSWRCRDCGNEFYGEAPESGSAANYDIDYGPVDEETLKAAEVELKKQADEENDHTFG